MPVYDHARIAGPSRSKKHIARTSGELELSSRIDPFSSDVLKGSSSMASQPEIAPPDTITPQSPPEMPPLQTPDEQPASDTPEIVPTQPDHDLPDRSVPEAPPPPD